MKKFIFLVMAALLLGSTVTGCKGKTESEKINDSIAQLMGKIEGVEKKSDLQFHPEKYNNLDKDQYLKGVMTIIKMDTTKNNMSYVKGLEDGLELYNKLCEYDYRGISIDRRLFLSEFKKVLSSKDTLDMKKFDNQFKAMNYQLEEMTKRSIEARGKENLEAGKKYIEEVTKKDNDYKKATSGVYYKIVEQGKGNSFDDSSIVDMKLLCKDLNNNIIINVNTPRPALVGQIKKDPRFGKLYDVIKTMKPGSKAIVIMPADTPIPEEIRERAKMELPDANSFSELFGLSRNLTLVFEITTVGLHK